jgi:hypothetical protein
MNPLRWRKMTWVLVLFTVLMAAWIVSALGSQPACPPDVVNCEAYQAGANVGTGIGVAFLFGIWFVGFIILSIIWFMTRPARRVCPVCGTEARKGQTVCKKCGYDFAGTATPNAVPGSASVPTGAVGIASVQPWTGALSDRHTSSMATVNHGTRLCPSCGQENDIGDRFCSGCGTRLVMQSTP